MLAFARHVRLLLGVTQVAAHGLGNLGQVAAALGRHDDAVAGRGLDAHRRQPCGLEPETDLRQVRGHGLVQGGHAVVVEPRRDGAEHGHGVGRDAERLAIALHLLAHVTQGVEGAAAVELVHRHEVGEVEHVDLLELAGGAELGRHHVERGIDVRDDGGVALADAGGLDDHQIEPRHLAGGDDFRQARRDLAAGGAGGERAEVDVWVRDRIHADAVAEQGAAALAPRGVDRDDRDAQPVGLVEAEAADQLVGKRGFAGAAGAGDAEHRHPRGVASSPREFGTHAIGGCTRFQRRNEAGQVTPVAGGDAVERGRGVGREIGVGALDHVVDHALQAEGGAVLGRVDARHAVVVQLRDLALHDHPAAAAEHLDVAAAALAQQIDHVFEELDVAALVGRHRDALDIFVECRGDDLVDRTVVAEMDHLGAAGLQQAPHDVDRRVVAVEQAGRGHEADLVPGLVAPVLLLHAQVGHGGRCRFWLALRSIVIGQAALRKASRASVFWASLASIACQCSSASARWRCFTWPKPRICSGIAASASTSA